MYYVVIPNINVKASQMATNEVLFWRNPIVSQRKRNLMSQVNSTRFCSSTGLIYIFTGPGTYKTASNAGKKLSAAKHASDARYAILLKKVGALQKVHADCKKAVREYLDPYGALELKRCIVRVSTGLKSRAINLKLPVLSRSTRSRGRDWTSSRNKTTFTNHESRSIGRAVLPIKAS